ncbi:MAG: hypothetical protein MJZ89_01530 [Paludibacteraceae bacterium]|nr:hypothetical protein [Paludibacteraceae bacterium]
MPAVYVDGVRSEDGIATEDGLDEIGECIGFGESANWSGKRVGDGVVGNG